MQQKYLGEIDELYGEDFNVVCVRSCRSGLFLLANTCVYSKMPQLTEEIRGVDKIKSYAPFCFCLRTALLTARGLQVLGNAGQALQADRELVKIYMRAIERYFLCVCV